MVERDGPLRSQVIPNELKSTILPIVQANVAQGSKVSTDLARHYKALKRMGYDHERVNHQIEEWVRGDIHTNTIEGFWSHLKRGIKSSRSATTTGKRLPRCSKGSCGKSVAPWTLKEL